MKPRLPFFLTQALLLAYLTSFSSSAVDVASWEELKAAFSQGEGEFKLTQDVVVPLSQGDGHLSGITVEEWESLSIDGRSPDGGRFRFRGTAGAASEYGTASRAFYGTGDMDINSCWFDRNYVALTEASDDARGGAMYVPGAEGLLVNDCVFTGNHVLVDPGVVKGIAEGGAVYSGKGVFQNCTFEGNYVSASSGSFGGAVSGEGNLVLEDCRFLNNYALRSAQEPSLGSSYGGGLYYHVKPGGSSTLEITAREKDSVFRGNAQYASQNQEGKLSGGVANAIYLKTMRTSGPCEVHFRASAGRSLLFYDPVFFDSDRGTAPVMVYLNKEDGRNRQYSGRIVFSGEDYRQSGQADDRISYCAGNVRITQGNGEVIIREGAVLGLSPEEYGKTPEESRAVIGMKRYEVQAGILEISSGGWLLAETLRFDGSLNCTWRVGSGARLDAKILDLSSGVTVDFQSGLDTGDSGIRITADDVLLGGALRIEDKYNEHGLERLDFYMDTRWANRQKYLVFDFTKQADIKNDFSQVVSRQTGVGAVDSPYGYQGKWKEVWEDSDGDAVKDKLYLVWTPAGSAPDPDDPDDPGNPDNPDNPNPQPPVYPGIREIHPELAGTLVMNSLWGAAFSLRTFSQASLERLDVARLQSGQKRNYYVTGLGSSGRFQSTEGVDGYDYSGYGWSAGADTLLGSGRRVAGFAFGGMDGKNKSRDYSSEVSTSVNFMMLYYGWMKEMSPGNLLKICGSAAYGMTSNSLDTYYRDGMESSGSWNSDSMRLTLRGEWIHTLDSHWMLTTFAGIEYDNTKQNAFTEAGGHMRSFSQAHMGNLALPLGVGIDREDDYGDGMKWHHRLALSLVPDVYRRDPDSEAVMIGNGFTWTARGAERERFSFRLDYATRFHLDAEWSLFAGYTLEGRKDAFDQMINAGVGASF